MEDQPRHLTRYSSLPCGERRAGGEPRRAPGARGGGGVFGRGRTHLAEPLAQNALGGEDLLAHAAQLLHAAARRGPRPADPGPTVAHKAPPPPRPAPRTRAAVARAALPGAVRPIGARGWASIVRSGGGGGEDWSVGLVALCAAWSGCVLRGPWGPTAPNRMSPRKAIVWAEGGETGSTRLFLSPPARDAASHQPSISCTPMLQGQGCKQEKYRVAGEHRKASLAALLKATEGRKLRSLKD